MSLTTTHAGVAQTSTGNDQKGGKIIQITPTIPIGSPTAFALGDCMTETLVEIPDAVGKEGGFSMLHGITMLNKDSEDCELRVIFFENNSTSAFGTANAAPTLTAENALLNNPLAVVSISTSNQNHIGDFYIGSASEVNSRMDRTRLLKAATGSTSVYFVIVSADTATLASTTDITLIFSMQYL